MIKKVYIGADHAGFSLKEKIKVFLEKNNFDCEDLGGQGKSHDDYPDYAFKVAKSVSRNKDSLGILICGTGTGMVMAANKVKGIRAAVVYDDYSAKMSKLHNNANILCLRGRNFSNEKNLHLIKTWLKSSFSGEERHKRRLKKIDNYEK